MEKTTQLSGLTDYELELEGVIDSIKSEPSTLKCINILRSYIEGPIPEKEPETWYVDVKTGYIWKPHFRKGWWTSPSTHVLKEDWDIQDGVSMGFLKLYEHKDRIEASLPKEENKEDIYLFLLSNTPYPGKYGNSFRIRSDFKLLEKEILVNSHCKEIEIIVLGEAEGGYWCRAYNSDYNSYVPPECFEYPWVKGNI